ncbi:Histidine biosynthesis bifunctional protein HisB [bacterium HR24]|jgi:imidazoleglycerol-phosphate dehydratase|nr:Histidine biosynthesis bifunctional protein HisB [bacterium HR24]
MTRQARVLRQTGETRVEVAIDLDGRGQGRIRTGIGMFDHLLEQVARHGLFDISIEAEGDLDREAHHLVEDVGLALGQALDEALGERRGVVRFGHAIVPLDEALAMVALDLGGRPHAKVDLPFRRDYLGALPTEMVPHFLASLAQAGRLALHVRLLAGENDHHRAEAAFKALALALRQATRPEPRLEGEVPSTKGVL